MKPSSSDCERAIAALISSTKRRTRPLTLVQIAKELRIAMACFGSIEDVAERIGLTESMLRRFQYVERLDSSLQRLVELRKIDSIDAVAELSSLPVSQQQELATILESEPYDTEDIRGFVRFINNHKELPLSEVVERIRASKTKRLFVYEFVARESMRDPDVVRRNVLKMLKPEDLDSVLVHGTTGKLKLTKSGKARVSEEAKRRRMSVTNFVQRSCEGFDA